MCFYSNNLRVEIFPEVLVLKHGTNTACSLYHPLPIPRCCQQLRISEGKLGWNSSRDIWADNYCIIFLQRLSSSDSSNATQMAQPHNKSFASISHLVCNMVSHHWKPCCVAARYEDGINLYPSVHHPDGDLIHKLLIWGSFEIKLKHIEPWNIDSLQWWYFKDLWLAYKRSSKDLFDLLSSREKFHLHMATFQWMKHEALLHNPTVIKHHTAQNIWCVSPSGLRNQI